MASRAVHLSVGICVIVGGFCVLNSQGKSTHHVEKRASESLYDNIYSAIADFKSEDQAQQESDEAREKRQTFASLQGQLPRGGRQEQRRVIVDGFPTGLPNGTPRGVQIALASLAETGEMPPIPGEAGVDFPVYPEVPVTGFDCGAQTFPGIYADTEAQCQVFHMCQPNGNYNSFLCPNGTVFNQQYFICDWWYNFDCGAAENFYGLNEFLYEENPEGTKCTTLFCSEEGKK